MKKIYVLDAVNFLFRSYYAIGPITNPKGESTNALYGFIRSVFKIIKDFSPEYLVAVFDGPQSTQGRKALFSEYKMHRKKMPDDLYPQLEKAELFCKLAHIPFLAVPGVEADDVMGSIANWGTQQNFQTFLCTSDKDLCQLVSDQVFVINVSKDNLLMDREKVKETFGVAPDQIVDLLALMGDSSDNIPGIEGIGPKTASSLLQDFGSLDGILAGVEKITGKKQEAIKNGRENALLSRELATIHIGVEFPKDEEFFKLRPPEQEKLKEFYQEMHFMTLLKELNTPSYPTKSSIVHEKDLSNPQYILINDADALKQLVQTLIAAKEICIDTETTALNPMQADLVGIGFCINQGHAWYVPLNGNLGKEETLNLLAPLWAAPKVAFFGHNIKYDLHALQNAGITLRNISFDTILASYLLAPQKQRHGLDHLALEYFGKVKIPITDLIGKGQKQLSMSSVALEKISNYCCEDVDFTFRLKEIFERALVQEELMSLFKNIELPLIPILMHMERRGIYVDLQHLKIMSEELSEQLALLQNEIYRLAGEVFNLNSPKQLSHILFEKLQIKPPKKTQTGYSTSADILESLKETSPIISKILDYRTLEKLRSTYVDALPEQVFAKTQRIHCNFNQSVTATGRLSCQDPNLQNIPVRSLEGRKIREAFKPSLADWSFLAADYSQIELRLLAHLSEDPILMNAFQNGEDIHSYTASLVFGVLQAEVTSEMRRAAKAVNFGIIYGQQAFGLSKELGISVREAAQFIETYFDRYRKVKEYLESCKDQVRKSGKALTITGRQRPIAEIHSPNPAIRAAAERLAVNTPLQGTAADLIKLAMIHIDALLKKQQSAGNMILQIHDELIFEIPDTHSLAMAHEIKKTMENVMKLKVPLIVDISIGKNWGEC